MRSPFPALCAWARLSLLVAALLHVVGGVAEPRLHAHAAAQAPLAVIEAAQDPGSVPEPQEDRFCFVCQVLGGAGLPQAPSWLPEAPVSVVGVLSELDAGLPSSRTASAQARAPPTA